MSIDNPHSLQRAPGWTLGLAAFTLLAPSVVAEPIVSQTPTINSVSASDIGRFTAFQSANQFALAEADTVRSVTWRGIFVDGVGANPDIPLTFNLIIYNDATGVPGTEVLNQSITFTTTTNINDTGQDVTIGGSSRNIYELRADVAPTALAVGTTYWFSPVANTPDDLDNFYWGLDTSAVGSPRATKVSTDAWTTGTSRDFYYVLDNAPIPEPSSLALLTLGGLLIGRPRR